MVATLCYCGGMMVDGCCDRCKRSTKRNSHRDYRTTADRGYDYEWRCLSERIRAERPLCEDCLKHNRTRPSKHCHHKLKIKDYPELRLDPDNILALCIECHDERTKRGE